MTAEVKEHIGEIRGVKARWVDVIVAGHTVEQVLSFDVAGAEAVHGRPFDDELDEHIQMGIFAVDRIAADGTMHKVASARSYGPRRQVHKDREDRSLQRDRAHERWLAHHPSGRH